MPDYPRPINDARLTADMERVVIDQESLQAIYKNFQDHDVGYAFVKSVSALKLENLSLNYR